MKTINARGKPCPEPVILTKAVVDQGETELEVLLDNPTSASNVIRFLESRRYNVHLKDDEGMLTIAAQKKNGGTAQAAPIQTTPQTAPPKKASMPPSAQTYSILVTAKTLGRNDEQLGEILIKSLLGTLSQLDVSPIAVALMNEGVKLALYDSSSCDHLKTLEKKGVAVLICGTCVNHFCLADQIGVGNISNMFEILEALNRADKVITL